MTRTSEGAVAGQGPGGRTPWARVRPLARGPVGVTRAVVLAALVSGTAAGCATAQASGGGGEGRSSATEYAWRGTMPSGGTLEVKGVNGGITAEPAQGSEVVVTATLRGRRSDPAEVSIERVEHAGGITFCAVYPTPSGDRANSCAPRDGGRMNTRRNDVVVDFHVRVPANVPLRAVTVNGGVRATDLGADVDAVTVNGSIDVGTRGTATARTVNGSIEARMQQLRGDVSFETVNGRITVALPEGVDADLEARWLNGNLESDVPIALVGRLGRGRASGTLGRGGPKVTLATVNGAIRIR